MKPNVLIVEDDGDWLDIYAEQLKSEDYDILTARSVRKATRLIDSHEFAVVATDLRLAATGREGFDVLKLVLDQSPDTQVIIFTGYGSTEAAIEATRLGAYDYIVKPLDFDRARQVIQSAIRARDQLVKFRATKIASLEEALPHPERFVGSSAIMGDVLSKAAQQAKTTTPVLIVGISGVGKGILAEKIHMGSGRHPFNLVNCTSFSEAMLDRILFGFMQENGERAPGLLELTHGGTLVLDRIGGMRATMQEKVFKALSEDRLVDEVQSIDIPLDLKVIALAQTNLSEYVEQNLFMETLFEWLSQVTIEIPPLRERRDRRHNDILELAEHFVQLYAKDRELTISREAKDLLNAYPFPRNVWELQEVIRAATVACCDPEVLPEHLPAHIQLHGARVGLGIEPHETYPAMVCPHGNFHCNQVERIAQNIAAGNYLYARTTSSNAEEFTTIIQSLSAEHGLITHQPGQIGDPKVPLCQICTPIQFAKYAVFDLSQPNASLFYEIGIAQTLGVRTILVKMDGDRLPAGMENLNIYEYHDEAELRHLVGKWLAMYNDS